MTYQEYFRKTNFEEIWAVLSGFYGEDERLKSIYEALVTEIKELPILPEQSTSTIKMQLDPNNEIMIVAAPDPQEWLLGREVETDFSYWRDNDESEEGKVPNIPFDMLSSKQKRQLARRSDTATLAAHLLYWSTLYAIKTSRQHAEVFAKWIEDSFNEVPRKYTMEQEYEAKSRHNKRQKYWRNTVCRDSAIDWSENLRILRRKLEYNIGYWRYVQRHEGWEEDVRQMQLTCSLIDIVVNQYTNITGIYVNTFNAKRFYRDTVNFEDPDFGVYNLGELRRAKAYDILWRFLSKNMIKWWD